jgi:hypothetical protein
MGKPYVQEKSQMGKVMVDGKLVDTIKIPYEECPTCGDCYFHCVKCLTKNHIDTIGIHKCINCDAVYEVVQ